LLENNERYSTHQSNSQMPLIQANKRVETMSTSNTVPY